jgi:lipopolysaccharide/colanic/teichoic acid biosynthesis glycosyltransferase/radical SAM superfamily enzyme YgiQ (UPF0313 family)
MSRFFGLRSDDKKRVVPPGKQASRNTASIARISRSRTRRVLDVAWALVGLAVFSPVFLAVALAILWDDGRPFFFNQARLGLSRRTFAILKFRTMRSGCVTRVGRWLRRTGIDEAPQFWNVLRGDMSMVGPRPITAEDAARFGWTATRFEWRWETHPGITGLAQIFGRDPRHARRLDHLYCKRRTAFSDLKLIALSFVINIVGKRFVREHLARKNAPLLARFNARAWRQVPEAAAPRAFREPPRLSVPESPPGITRGATLLINPFYPKDPHASFGKHVLTPTLALTSIAGATPPEYAVRYWDENLMQGPPPTDPVPEVVGITVHLTFARRAYELAALYRSLGSRVVLGGLHVTSCPDEAEPHADVLVLGEGVGVWPRVLEDLREGRAQKRYEGSFRGPYESQPAPDRRILPRESFLTTSSLIATRGCNNRCGFCYLATDGLFMPYQMLTPDEVVRQILENDQPYSVFVDNNLGSRPDYLRKLCAALKPLRRIWSAAVTIDVTDDPSLIEAMAGAGCTGVFVGFESLAAENLDDAGKKSPRPDDYARRVKILHDAGLQVNGSFVVGFDHDTPGSFERLAEWVEAARLECATFHILTPYPGTPLFRQLEREGRILHRNWDLYDTAHAVFRPAHMDPETLEAGYNWLYRRTFATPSIWARRPARRADVLPYLAQSLLYKKSNRLWEFLIRHRLVAAAWRPIVEVHRRRHFRNMAVRQESAADLVAPAPTIVSGPLAIAGRES